jgi:hypothetical protein
MMVIEIYGMVNYTEGVINKLIDFDTLSSLEITSIGTINECMHVK